MATKSEGKRKFGIVAHIMVEVMLDVRAESLDEALARSKELKVSDFVTFKGEVWDHDILISQIWTQELTCKL